MGIEGNTWGGGGGAAVTNVVYSQWHHIYLVMDGSYANLYVDGIFSFRKSYTSYTLASNFTIGRQVGYYFSGYLDEIKFYTYVRTASQIQMDYNSTLRGSNDGTETAMGGSSEKWMTNGLVGYWKMDEASWNGTSGEVKDSSGNNNNGTAYNGATTAGGKFGNGGSFDGVDDYVVNAQGIGTSGNGITVSYWLKTSSGGTTMGWSYIDCNIGYWTAHKISCTNDGTEYDGVVSSATVDDNNWHHIVFTSTNNREILYVDGVYQGTATATLNISNSYYVYWGRGSFGGTYSGSLDDGRIYDRVLSPDEVQKLYQWAPEPVGQWKMDEGSGTKAHDTSGNGLDASFVGTPIWTQGKFGGGIGISKNNYLSISDNSAIRPGTGDFTISYWIKTPWACSAAGNCWPNILGKGISTSALAHTWGFLGGGASTTVIHYFQSSDAGGVYDVDLSTGSLSNGWHFILVRRSATTAQLYVDGKYVTEMHQLVII